MTFLGTYIGQIIHNRKRTVSSQVACITASDLLDIGLIEEYMESLSILVVFVREIRSKRPMEAKRFLQRIKSLVRKFDYSILTLGKIDYILMVPSEYIIEGDLEEKMD